MARRRRFSAIDLFCGCGGLTLGLRRAGFKVVAAIDNDPLSTATYEENHRRTNLVRGDIRSIDPVNLMGELGLASGDLDLIAGCPPCQGFSTLRTLNGGRDVDEPMNDLVHEFVRFVQVFLPKTLMMENVPALLGDHRFARIEQKLGILGYSCAADLFDAQSYGVPQRRLRMILVGARDGCPRVARPAKRRRTVAGTIRKLERPAASEDALHNYRVRRTERVMSLIRQLPKSGGSRTDLSEEHQLECHRRLDGFKDVYGRMAWGKPAPTITGGCINPSKGRFIHPEEDRAITLREAALLQGFPSSYRFDVSKGRYPLARIIGNAFPPKFAEHHARALYRHLEALADTPQHMSPHRPPHCESDRPA